MAQYKTPKNKSQHKTQNTPPAVIIDNTLIKGFSIKQIQVLVLFVFSFFLYSNTIPFDYALDDAIVITENKFTKEGFSGIKDILTKDTFHGFFGENKQLVSGGRYRPLSLVTFAIEYELFGMNSHISHFINVLLYFFTGLLLLWLLYEFFPGNKRSLINIPFLATFLFIAHPIHTEVTANIKGRDEIMCLMGCIAALLLLFRYNRSNKLIYGIGSLIVFFLALMSKENAITFLAIIPLSLYFFSKQSLGKTALQTLPFILITGIFWLLRGSFTKSSVDMEVTEVLNNPFVYMTAIEKYATIFYTWGKYLWLLIYPHPLTHDYYYNQIPAKSLSDIGALTSLVIYVGLFIYALMGLKRRTVISFSILFYLITFSIVSNFLFPIGTTMSERFVFIPSIGFSLATAYLLIKGFKIIENDKFSFSKYKAFSIIAIAITLGYSFKTVNRNYAWTDNLTLFTTDVKTSPNSAKLRNSTGGELMAASDKEQDSLKRKALLEESIKNLNRALEIYPEYVGAYLLLGNAYFKYNNQYEKAIESFSKIIPINPDYPDAYYNLGVTYKMMGKTDLAIKNFLKLLTYRPNDLNSYYTVGDLYKSKNNPDSAIGFYYKVSQLDPSYPGIYREIGNVYGQLKGDMVKAEQWLNKALEQDPKDKSAMENLGIVYGIQKEYGKAVGILERALQLDPNNANIYQNLGVTYSMMGEKQKAQEYLNKAAQLSGR